MSRPGHSLPPGKTWYPLYRKLGGPQGQSGQVRKISPPPGFDPQTVRPTGNCYTDYSTQPSGLHYRTNYALQIQALSFTLDDDEEDEAATGSDDDSDAEKCELPVKKKIRKNPDVDTSFLPDREREDEENKLREELRQVHSLFPKVQCCTACECYHHLSCVSC